MKLFNSYNAQVLMGIQDCDLLHPAFWGSTCLNQQILKFTFNLGLA
jgi:hypothetical protein